MAHYGHPWSVQCWRAQIFATVATAVGVVSGVASQAQAQSIVGWGLTGFSNIDDLTDV